jgi:predicted Rossmann fold flavoprotein
MQYVETYSRELPTTKTLTTQQLSDLDVITISSNEGLTNLVTLIGDPQLVAAIPLIVPSVRAKKLAEDFGHTLMPLTPALVALVLDGDFHVPLSGISHEVEMTVQVDGVKPVRVRGIMLWTHFGISGPATLDMSRYWHRARIEQREVKVFVNLVNGQDSASVKEQLLGLAAEQPRIHLCNALARWLPARVADAILIALDISGSTPMAHLPRDVRRKVVNALIRWPLPIRDSRGYTHAEVTAGGVPLTEVHSRPLNSRKGPGLYFTGEILEVDGRIGGFNFQWAWSSAWVVATALARSVKSNED